MTGFYMRATLALNGLTIYRIVFRNRLGTNLLFRGQKIGTITLREKGSYSELFWSAFYRIWTEYGEILLVQWLQNDKISLNETKTELIIFIPTGNIYHVNQIIRQATTN